MCGCELVYVCVRVCVSGCGWVCVNVCVWVCRYELDDVSVGVPDMSKALMLEDRTIRISWVLILMMQVLNPGRVKPITVRLTLVTS